MSRSRASATTTAIAGGSLGRERGRVVYLSLSTHHTEGGVGLPYIWVQGTPALVWQVAEFFRA